MSTAIITRLRSITAPQATTPDRISLDEATSERIKYLILANQFRPGHKLTNQHLAERLGVSRTPVRQSLERLYQEGYVIRIPARGYFVAEMKPHEARDLYDMRQALELHALSASFVQGIPAAGLEQLDAHQRAYVACVSANASQDRLLADQEFHLTLASFCGNRYLLDSLHGVFDRLGHKRRVEGYWPDNGRRGAAGVREHERLLSAIRRRRPSEAERILEGHIRKGWVHFEAHLLRIGTAPRGTRV